MSLLLSFISFIATTHREVTSQNVTFMMPTFPPNDTSQIDCYYTLNEWIDSGISSLSNETMIVLLPGVHFVNTTKERLVIEDINKLTIIGYEDSTIISCLHWYGFEFINVDYTIIANITFQHCFSNRIININDEPVRFTLLFSCPRNVTVTRVKITYGGILLVQCQILPTFSMLSDLKIVSGGIGIYSTSKPHMPCSNSEEIHLLNSELQNSSLLMKSQRSCIKFCLQRVVITGIVNNKLPALFISSIAKVLLHDLIIQNSSSPILSIKAESVELKGYCLFYWNHCIHAAVGSYIQPERSLVVHSNSKIEFCNNDINGSILYLFLSHHVYAEININKSTVLLENNKATYNGGIMVIEGLGDMNIANSTVCFTNNSCHYSSIMKYDRGRAFTLSNTTIVFNNNKVKHGGIMIFDRTEAIRMSNSIITFENCACFGGGVRSSHDAILLFLESVVTFHQSNLNFYNNDASTSGGLTIVDTKLHTSGDVNATFRYNKGGNGGAMSFYEGSQIVPFDNSFFVLHFHSNTAYKKGGAMFIEDSGYYLNKFTQRIGLPFIFSYAKYEVQAYFSENVAEQAGNDIYGGWIDRIQNARDSFILSDSSPYTVSSNPIRVCMCINSVPVCNITEYQKDIFPGQTFEIEVVAVGQRFGIVPSIVTAQISDGEGSLSAGQNIQSTGKRCKSLYFTVFSIRKLIVINITVQEFRAPCKDLSSFFQYLCEQFSVQVTLKECPVGFQFSKSKNKCQCSPQIMFHREVSCDFVTYNIIKAKHIWLLSEQYNVSEENWTVIHDHCPYDYCRAVKNSLSFNLEFPDEQCAYNRSGVLCGACRMNLSQVLGTSVCRKCSNIYVLVLLPSFLSLGILLVGLLMLLNLTVSSGTIHGLIFYANIIRLSQVVFFPPDINTSFLSMFIAWLNLDLGIETCFFNGLDAYAKTWLQFVFPLYIWLMVITVIVASHYSTTVSKLSPNNALEVLATLFLLSYTKILRVVTTVFASTVLIYPDGFKKRVWLYDGNIQFMSGKHNLLLFVYLLLLLLFSIPYTLLLVSIQWLQRMFHYRPLLWMYRLMPLFDAYTEPFKHRHQYWTGLLLLVRVILIVIFTFNVSNNRAINLLAVAVTTFVLLTYASYMRVYKNWRHNMIEMAFLLNLEALSVITFYKLLLNENTVLTTYMSTSITFILFVIIVIYHITQQLISLRVVRDNVIWLNIAKKIARVRVRGDEHVEQDQNRTYGRDEVTFTYINLQELIKADKIQSAEDNTCTAST